jgi:glycosyltransferase involved in cell wall biosynthesis
MSQQAPEPSDVKRRILVLCDYYLPSTKSGGGMWTVVNLVERFSDRYSFFVVARNHESRNDTKPFTTVKTGQWNDVGQASVFYLRGNDISVFTIARLVREVRPDGVFLNSVFSNPSVKFLVGRRFRLFDNVPVVLAACGEVSPEAINLKPWKKKPFLFLARVSGLFEQVIWKASSESESEEIRDAIGPKVRPLVAPDLPPRGILPEFSPDEKPSKTSGHLKLIFYSRIARKKNLPFLLERLRTLTDGRIELTIAGPVEDEKCWSEAQEQISKLPENMRINIVGTVSYAEGLALLKQHHLFVLPTVYENFGYVVLEALAAGCPVLVSERTIWTSEIDNKAGRAIPLDQKDVWESALKEFVGLGHAEYSKMSVTARQVAATWLSRPENEMATKTVLEKAYGPPQRNELGSRLDRLE